MTSSRRNGRFHFDRFIGFAVNIHRCPRKGDSSAESRLSAAKLDPIRPKNDIRKCRRTSANRRNNGRFHRNYFGGRATRGENERDLETQVISIRTVQNCFSRRSLNSKRNIGRAESTRSRWTFSKRGTNVPLRLFYYSLTGTARLARN